MKGAFESRPSLPLKSRVATWDVNTVLSFLETWYPHDDITLKELSLKLAVLLALLSGQRCQTIYQLDINCMTLTSQKCTFFISNLLKHSRKGCHQKPLEFLAFENCPQLCIVNVITVYLKKTEEHRKNSNTSRLLLSFKKPHLPISKDTLGRWIKSVLDLAGIDIAFSAHSTRSASTSAASEAGVPLTTILEAAGWSQESTFTRFYKKLVPAKHNFGQSLLDKYLSKSA